MISQLTYAQTSTYSILEQGNKLKKILIKWVHYIPKDNMMIIPAKIDEFQYPSLEELRKTFEMTGKYTKQRIDEILEAYERLPKYRAQSNSAPRSKKRS